MSTVSMFGCERSSFAEIERTERHDPNDVRLIICDTLVKSFLLSVNGGTVFRGAPSFFQQFEKRKRSTRSY